MQDTKLVRAEITDIGVITFVNTLEYGQMRQIITNLLKKAVKSISKDLLTKGALIDGRFEIVSKV